MEISACHWTQVVSVELNPYLSKNLAITLVAFMIPSLVKTRNLEMSYVPKEPNKDGMRHVTSNAINWPVMDSQHKHVITWRNVT